MITKVFFHDDDDDRSRDNSSRLGLFRCSWRGHLPVPRKASLTLQCWKWSLSYMTRRRCDDMTIDKTMIVVATNWQFWWYNQLTCIERSWPGQYLLASLSDKECNTPALHNIGKHWIVGVSQLEPNCGYYRKMLGPIKRKRLWVHGGIASLIKNILEKVVVVDLPQNQ